MRKLAISRSTIKKEKSALLNLLKKAPQRFKNALGYSMSGLVEATRREESFKLEIIGFIVLIATMIFVPWLIWKKVTMILVYLLIPLCEIINSALEDICNLISPDYHPLVKSAKDKGSAAVLLAIIINILALILLIIL